MAFLSSSRGVWACIGAALSLSACQTGTLSIDGYLSNIADGPVYLSVFDSTMHSVVVDTAMVSEGHFAFENCISLQEPECLTLSVGNQKLLLFAGNDNVSITGNMLMPEKVSVRGSESNELLRSFVEKIPDKERLAQLELQLKSVTGNVDKSDAIVEEINAIKTEQDDFIRLSVERNVSNPVGIFILLNNLPRFSFDDTEAFCLRFKEAMPHHKYVAFLSNLIDEKRPQNDALKRVEVGCEAPDFVLLDEHGDSVRLSNLRGDNVLIDFWKSDSEACRENSEIVIAVYEKFADKGLVVLGVSLDSDKNAWLNAKNEYKLPGLQVWDSLGHVAREYCVSNLPYSVTINEYGVIVSKDLAGRPLFEDLSSRLRPR